MTPAEVPKKRRRRLGDRSDGYRLRTLFPLNRVMCFVMRYRSDSLNTFADTIAISAGEKYCREKAKSGLTNFGTLHLLLAAYVRMIAAYPATNRFISGQRTYHRHDIEINMTVKKTMTSDSEETVIKVVFDPRDTAEQVYEKFNAVVQKSIGDNPESDFDSTAKILSFIPDFLLRFAFFIFRCLDYLGWLPKSLLKVSPFHGTMIITSMGSLGIKPIYHHLYDFGNLPVFLSYGIKRDELYMTRDGTVRSRRVIDIKAVTDERICDGFYFANAFKYWKRLIENPSQLDLPPEEVLEDID